MILTDMVEESSLQEIDRHTKKHSHKETGDIEGDIIIVLIEDVGEIKGDQSQKDGEYHGKPPFPLGDESGDDMSDDSAYHGNDNDDDRAFWHFIEDIYTDFQHLLPYGGRDGPERAYRHQQPEIFFDDSDDTGNGGFDGLSDILDHEMLIISEEIGRDDSHGKQCKHDP